MTSIEIDDDVFSKLKAMAEPFVDTPNTVLRRILQLDKQTPSQDPQSFTNPPTIARPMKTSSGSFMKAFLSSHYKESFRSVSSYRTMYESENFLVYFQNFNKEGTNNLWYRLSGSALSVLRNSRKKVLVCLTNPAENFLYEFPLQDIDQRARECNWDKQHYEVNIDPASSRWRDLDWRVEKYFIKFVPN